MSSSSNYDTPSPRTHQSDASATNTERSGATSPSPVRRPSFEKLDSNEVAKALQIADLLKTAKSSRPQPHSQPQAQPQPQSTPAPPPTSKQHHHHQQQAKEKKAPSPPPAEYIPRPPPIPFSGTSNPDAVALRATTDILQIQKARATENIQRLEQLKVLNRQDPKEFLRQLVSGNLKAGEGEREGILGPTVGPEVEKLLAALEVGGRDGGNGKAPSEEKINGAEKETTAKETTAADTAAAVKDTSTPLPVNNSSTAPLQEKDYPRFPAPQNIVRTPAINWAKYGILGDTLEAMHNEQRTNPSLGEPERLASRNSQPATPVVEAEQILERGPPMKAAKFVMAAPYDPLKDQLKKGRKPV